MFFLLSFYHIYKTLFIKIIQFVPNIFFGELHGVFFGELHSVFFGELHGVFFGELHGVFFGETQVSCLVRHIEKTSGQSYRRRAAAEMFRTLKIRGTLPAKKILFFF